MSYCEHDVQGDENFHFAIDEEISSGWYFELEGNGSRFQVYVDAEQLQQMCNALGELGFEPGAEEGR